MRIKIVLQNVRCLFILLMVCFLSSCFSPWRGGEGTLTLRLAGSSGRSAVSQEEQASLAYTITLTGSGPSITQTFPAGAASATFKLQPGIWNVTVKGRGTIPEEYSIFSDDLQENAFPENNMLRAYGEKTVTVRGGGSISEPITMFPAVEAANGPQLSIAFSLAGNDNRKEYVFITNDITVNSDTPGRVESGQNIELRAEQAVKIERENRYTEANTVIFQIEEGGMLTLGKKGETNQYLQISGEIDGVDQNGSGQDNPPYAEAPLIGVYGSVEAAALVMYDARIYHNRVFVNTTSPAPGVHVTGPSAKFIMHGGQIDGNTGNHSGGGVKVEFGGTFILNGGCIEGNEASYGGQVYVGGVSSDPSAGIDGAFFYMNGGTLSGRGSEADTQADLGAGVCIMPGGTFTKTGGTIYGSGDSEYNLHANGDRGNAVFYDSSEENMINYIRNSTLEPNDNLSTENLEENWDWDIP